VRRLALAWSLAALACSGDSAPVGSIVVAEESRYQVVARATSPHSPSQQGELRIEVQTAGGWHIAPEAPARLDLEGNGIEFVHAALRADDKLSATEDGFVFATDLKAEAPGRHTATGKLKFGICEGPKAKCVIVREELAIPIDIAFADAAKG
jgi:hypothetical protein